MATFSWWVFSQLDCSFFPVPTEGLEIDWGMSRKLLIEEIRRDLKEGVGPGTVWKSTDGFTRDDLPLGPLIGVL